MIDARMDGTLEQRLMWRILALREALSDIETMRDGVTHQVARNGLLVDDGNAKLCTPHALSRPHHSTPETK